MKEISAEIGKRLIELRKKNKMTQQEVADGIPGLTIQMISSYENGKQSPAIDNLIKISNFFKVSIDFIVTGKKQENYFYNLSTYEDLIRTILKLEDSKIFTIKAFSKINLDCSGDSFIHFNLLSSDETLFEFEGKMNKLIEAKEIMGDDMYNIALEGLISKYKDIPIKK